MASALVIVRDRRSPSWAAIGPPTATSRSSNRPLASEVEIRKLSSLIGSPMPIEPANRRSPAAMVAPATGWPRSSITSPAIARPRDGLTGRGRVCHRRTRVGVSGPVRPDAAVRGFAELSSCQLSSVQWWAAAIAATAGQRHDRVDIAGVHALHRMLLRAITAFSCRIAQARAP